MENVTTPFNALSSLVNNHLANDSVDAGLVKSYLNDVTNAQSVSQEDADDFMDAYENWAFEVGELKQAEDTYHNADEEDEEDAEQEMNTAQDEVSDRADDVKRALSRLDS